MSRDRASRAVVLAVAALLLAAPAVARASSPSHTTSAPIPFLVVTDASLASEFEVLAAAHAAAGMPAEVRTLQEIRALQPAARDDAERIRLFLQAEHAAHGTRFVLFGGDEPLVPMRRVHVRGGVPGLPDAIELPTDQYYACLAGDWNADGDALWGEWPYPPDEPGDAVDATPTLFVGRAPVTTPAEAHAFVHKTIDALMPRPLSNLLLVASNLFMPTSTPDINAMMVEGTLSSFAGQPQVHVARLYEDQAHFPAAARLDPATLRDSLESGYDLALVVGGGSPGAIAAGMGQYLVAADLAALTNQPPSFAYLVSAYTTQPGVASIGSALMNAPGGAVSLIGCSDLQMTSMAGLLMRTFLDGVYTGAAPTAGEALAQAIVWANVNQAYELARLSTMGNVLFGDPALAWPGMASSPTPVELALVSADAGPDRVWLRWYAANAAGLVAGVERRTGSSEWTRVGTAIGDGTGQIEFVDEDVAAGTRYGYRLVLTESGAERFVAETWIDVPLAAGFALAGPSPNPASDAMRVAFSLSAASPARLELFDVAGRALVVRDVGAMGAGRHVVDLAEGRRFAPGVYLVRLTQGARSLSTRACVVR